LVWSDSENDLARTVDPSILEAEMHSVAEVEGRSVAEVEILLVDWKTHSVDSKQYFDLDY